MGATPLCAPLLMDNISQSPSYVYKLQESGLLYKSCFCLLSDVDAVFAVCARCIAHILSDLTFRVYTYRSLAALCIVRYGGGLHKSNYLIEILLYEKEHVRADAFPVCNGVFTFQQHLFLMEFHKVCVHYCIKLSHLHVKMCVHTSCVAVVIPSLRPDKCIIVISTAYCNQTCLMQPSY